MATGSLGEADKGTQYNNNLWCDSALTLTLTLTPAPTLTQPKP